jgi:hypothetical protein
VPILGGTLVPVPHAVVPLATDAAGGAVLPGVWPGAPSGTTLYAQAWVFDAGAVSGMAASNGVAGTVP